MHAGPLREKLEQFDEQWAPHVIAAVSDRHVKLAKLEGPFEWYHRDGARPNRRRYVFFIPRVPASP